MNEMVQGTGHGQDNMSLPGANSQPAQTTLPQTEEKRFTQSEVNALVGREKANAKLNAVEEYKRQIEQSQNIPQTHHTIAQPNSSEEIIRKMAAEEVQSQINGLIQEERNKRDAVEAQKVVENFKSKIAPGKEKYQDFDSVTGDMGIGNFPNVVRLLADFVDNSHDVYYEFGKDRTKLMLLEQLANVSANDAIKQIQRMSQSIKDNEQAGKIQLANEPLSKMRPSNTGMDNGVKDVSYYRKKWKV